MNKPRFSLDNQELEKLSRPSAYAVFRALLIIYLPIAAVVCSTVFFFQPWLWPLAVFVIGNRQYAAYSLLHDGIHFLLHPDRRKNEFMARWLLAVPLGIPLKKMRKNHLNHHRHLGHDSDPETLHLSYPEFRFPMSLWSFMKITLLDLSGLNWMRYRLKASFQNFKAGDYKLFFTGVLPFIISALLISFPAGIYFFFLWVFPLISVFQWLSRIRLSTEHFLLADHNSFGTRTMKTGKMESILFSPGNLGYHTEHHLFPQVPAHRLPELHRLLMKENAYRKGLEVCSSYSALIPRFIQ